MSSLHVLYHSYNLGSFEIVSESFRAFWHDFTVIVMGLNLHISFVGDFYEISFPACLESIVAFLTSQTFLVCIPC